MTTKESIKLIKSSKFLSKLQVYRILESGLRALSAAAASIFCRISWCDAMQVCCQQLAKISCQQQLYILQDQLMWCYASWLSTACKNQLSAAAVSSAGSAGKLAVSSLQGSAVNSSSCIFSRISWCDALQVSWLSAACKNQLPTAAAVSYAGSADVMIFKLVDDQQITRVSC